MRDRDPAQNLPKNALVTLRSFDSPVGTIYAPPDVPAGFSLFYTGRDFDGRLNEHSVDALRRTLRELSAIDASLSTCNQVHGTSIAQFSANESWCEHNACDALWSDARPSALGIKIADCLPVTIIDPESRVIVNIHAGWRGASADIVGTSLERVRACTSLDLQRAAVFLGPSIRSCCFEVGDEVVDAFRANFAYADAHVVRRDRRKPHVDLPGLVAAELVTLGVRSASINDAAVCTRCDERFHSYRRDKAEAGRNLAIVAQ